MSGILYFSISQYLILKRDSEVTQVKTNVDILFDAMVKYFRANCNVNIRPNGNYQPLETYNAAGSIRVSFDTLINGHYLEIPYNKFPINPIVNRLGTDYGYITQFNQIQNSAPPLLPQRVMRDNLNMGSIVLWQIQVSVEIKDRANAQLYRDLLGADCLSNMGNAGVAPCSSAVAGANQYAVWMRLPSFASSQDNSPTWVLKPTVHQFSQMYTTNPILTLTNGLLTGNQFYRCGGS